MKADHERIWLQNADDAAAIGASREWCSAPVWPDDPGDGEPTEYVRADLLATARADGRREGLEMAAKVVEADYETEMILLDAANERGMKQEAAAHRRACALLHRSITAIRALIGTDPTTDRGEG